MENEYIDYLVEKARVNARRKTKFNNNGTIVKKTHWVNHSGTFRDEELRKGPKYWHGQKPIRVYESIKSYQDLATAISCIASGEKNYSDYKSVKGKNQERLRLAQSWRDREISYNISDIIRLNYNRLRQELGFGKAVYGKVGRH